MPFPSARAWRVWLEANHDTSPGIWLMIAKKGAGVESVTYDEAVDEGLCFGWIDGQKALIHHSRGLNSAKGQKDYVREPISVPKVAEDERGSMADKRDRIADERDRIAEGPYRRRTRRGV
ncbi:MAG: hypothetical protein NVS3B21_22690 [Acidimicrobiales bacterium]